MSAKLFSLKAIALGTAAVGFSVSTANAACELVVLDPPSSITVDYDVYGFQRAFDTTEVQVQNIGDSICELEFVIEDVADAPPPFQFIQAGVAIEVNAPGLQRPQSDQVVQGIFGLSLAPNETQLVTLDFFTEQYVAVPSGSYARELSVGIRLDNTTDLLEEFVIDLGLNAIPRAQVNIAGSAGIFGQDTFSDFVDFGEPEVNESKRVFIQTRSNTVATVTIRSDNKGVMKHETANGSYIDYRAELDGTVLDLSGDVVISNLNATDLDGDSSPLDLTIEELVNPFAGSYSDRIVIEIEAQ